MFPSHVCQFALQPQIFWFQLYLCIPIRCRISNLEIRFSNKIYNLSAAIILFISTQNRKMETMLEI